MTDQTVVTALFDLSRRGQSPHRNLAFFQEHAEYVLTLDQPLVVFVDPELETWARGVRGDRSAPTQVIARPFESLETYKLVERAGALPAFENASSVQDVPLYQAVNWAKLEMVERVMEADPFDTDHFAWVDISIAHVALIPERFPPPADGVAVLTMRPVALAEIADRREFYAYERGRVAGGFIRGRRDRFERLFPAFWSELEQAFACGWRVNEQQVLSYLTAARPELFEPYLGDYSSVLVNTEYVRDGMHVVLMYLEHCRRYEMWERAVWAGDLVDASVSSGVLNLDEDQRAQWLDEFFVASLAVDDRERCARIARELLGCVDGAYLAREHDRIMTNLRSLVR